MWCNKSQVLENYILRGHLYVRRKVKNYPHSFYFFQFIYTTVGLNKYVIFLHSLLPFRCTWSSGQQAYVFPP
jgi:hypothetical protein